MRRIKLSNALITLHRLFGKTDQDELTLEEAASTWGRPEEPKQLRLEWLRDRLAPLKYHQLAEPVYENVDNRNTLSAIHITEQGRQALAGYDSIVFLDENESYRSEPISFEDLLNLTKQFQRENPGVRIRLTIE